MNNWYDAYDTRDKEHQPEAVNFSSRNWVKVRKDFEYVEGDGEFIEPHWHFLEKKIAKEDWDIFCDVQKQEITIDDIIDGMIELAGLITGGE